MDPIFPNNLEAYADYKGVALYSDVSKLVVMPVPLAVQLAVDILRVAHQLDPVGTENKMMIEYAVTMAEGDKNA
jgi:hypothetical protein